MTQYDNTNRFILSRNNRRETDKHPEFTGSINVNGVEYWMNAWVQERKDGSGKFFQGSIKRKDGKPEGSSSKTMSEQLNDEIPF